MISDYSTTPMSLNQNVRTIAIPEESLYINDTETRFNVNSSQAERSSRSSRNTTSRVMAQGAIVNDRDRSL